MWFVVNAMVQRNNRRSLIISWWVLFSGDSFFFLFYKNNFYKRNSIEIDFNVDKIFSLKQKEIDDRICAFFFFENSHVN